MFPDLKCRVVHDPAEGSHWDGAAPDVLVPVPVAVERRFRVVDVQALPACLMSSHDSNHMNQYPPYIQSFNCLGQVEVTPRKETSLWY